MKKVRVIAIVLVVLVAVLVLVSLPFTKSTSNESLPQATPTQSAPECPKFDEVSIDGLFDLNIVEQPSSDPAYVSTLEGTVTRFDMASYAGDSIGLMAHSTVEGKDFYEIQVGDIVNIKYQGVICESFKVVEVKRFRALTPDSLVSDFVEVDSNLRPLNQKVLTSSKVFNLTYGLAGHLILQTCIENSDDLEWGRLFVIAEPYIDDTQEQQLAQS